MQEFGDLQHYLTQLCAKLGVESVELDADGYCCVGFDDVILNIEHDEKRHDVLTYAELAELPAQPQPAYLLRVLEVNYASLLMTPGAIGVDTQARKIMFVERVPLLGLSYQGFEAALQSIVNRVESLQKLMISRGFAQPAEGETDEDVMRYEGAFRI
jgi:hypothetical protein